MNPDPRSPSPLFHSSFSLKCRNCLIWAISLSLNIKGADLRLRYIHLVILIAAFILGGEVPHGFAFSFGDIDIQSKYGEKFQAELEVVLEDEGNLQVRVGDEKDYRRLELDRPRIVDDLIVEQFSGTDGRRNTVRVVSKKPLFYPSFYLVVRGDYQGGTIIENYLITVDFQQSLALNVKGKPRSDVPSSREKNELLEGEEFPTDSETVVQPEDAKTPEVRGEVTTVFEKEKATEEQDSMTAGMEKEKGSSAPSDEIQNNSGEEETSGTPVMQRPEKESMVSKKSATPPTVNAPAWMAKPPTTIWGTRGRSSYFPGAGVPPPVTPPPMPPMDSPLPADGPRPDLNGPESSLKKLYYGPLTSGEGLLSVARKLNVNPVDAKRVAAALWLDNPESFLYGNMNGLKEGSQIRLENLDKRLEEIDSDLAEQILKSQWQEWRIIQNRFSLLEGEEIDGMTNEIPSPSEKGEQNEIIFEMLQAWKSSWESGDIDRHLALFSDRATGHFDGKIANLPYQKKRMFGRHKNIKLGIQEASLMMNGGQPVVSFDQSFSSEKMENYGRKDILFKWERGAWKIIKEKFKVRDYLEKSDLSPRIESKRIEKNKSQEKILAVPFVIHASSHANYQMATRVVNDLRELGFDGYSSPVNFPGKRKVYRVFVGRYAGLDLAREGVTKLRQHDSSRNAIPVKYPYAFLMGEFKTESEAQTLMQELRSRGLSPLLFTFSEKDFLNPRYRVFLGAFATKNSAGSLMAELNQKELAFKLITP